MWKGSYSWGINFAKSVFFYMTNLQSPSVGSQHQLSIILQKIYPVNFFTCKIEQGLKFRAGS